MSLKTDGSYKLDILLLRNLFDFQDNFIDS